MKLHIDIETYSSTDIKSAGAYRYMEALDFEILLVAYAFDDGSINIVDLARGEKLPAEFFEALQNPDVEKHAHSAVFERKAFEWLGYKIPPVQWFCSAIKAAYCGLPLSLEGVSKALHLEDKGKSAKGKALIKYFSCPCKPTKVNGRRYRNFPHHDLEKWQAFKDYCIQDVVAEREVDNQLKRYTFPETERLNYILDQEINDRGVLIDIDLAQKALDMDSDYSAIIKGQMKELTGVDNPNSAAQLKGWLSEAMGKEIKSLAKDEIPILIEEAECGTVKKVLRLRKKASKTSIRKYSSMLNCFCDDRRAHGMFQFYGANRTGRFAGRLIQLHNLPQNHLTDLQGSRDMLASGDFELATLMYDDISSVLSQLIRTSFIAKKGHTFAVADFSAIEARVIAWLAGEQWRMDVFNTHGKIYEASASMMFKVPIEEIGKGSDLRAKGKISELALGFGGAVGALTKMDSEGALDKAEMKNIVDIWRRASPAIVQLWKSTENYAKRAIKTRKKVVGKHKGLVFEYDGMSLTIQLPSGRKLFYHKPSFTLNKWQQESIQYWGMDQETKQWGLVESWGGKFVENIVQAIARDILTEAMRKTDARGFPIVMHVHDEEVVETPIEKSEDTLKIMCEIMGEEIPWAKGLPLRADGFITPFYKKD